MTAQPRVPTLTFIGGAGTVTGSKTLVDTPTGRVLVDCGLFQGRKELRLQNWSEFPVPPQSIDAIVLTHAHVDHCGYLPRLVRLGFRGRAYGTTGTGKLLEIVLPDSGHLQEEDAAYANRKGYSKHDPALPLYTEQDALASLDAFEPVEFGATVEVFDGVAATWRRAGHILGAASIDLHIGSVDEHVVFSGDLGHGNHPLLLPPADVGTADVLVLESTYGDRLHPEADPGALIEGVVNEAARRGGVVVIPAFAVDRTEVVLWHLDRLVGAGRVPDLPVFVDSPMACRALDVYRAEAGRGSPEFRPEYVGANLFPSLQLREVRTVEESKELNDRRGPAIIISASGMATGGRVLHHLAHRLGDDRNAVLLVGFQAPGTRGDALRHGVRQVKMLGRYHQVRAVVSSIELSSHADQNALVGWARTATTSPRTVFVNHGEAAASAALAAALDERAGLMAVCSRPGERVGLGV